MRSSTDSRASRGRRRDRSKRALGAIAWTSAVVGFSGFATYASEGARRPPAATEVERTTATAPTKTNSETAPATLAALLSGFRAMSGFEARFEEERRLALLVAPLRSRGRLYFSPPGTLLRRVEAPNPHDILIHEHVVRIATPRAGAAPGGAPGSPANARDLETIDLARRDDVRPLVESMSWIFSGDLEALEAIYRIDYQVVAPPASGRWMLRLAPRQESLSRLIRELVISGRGHAAESIEVSEAGGDRTTMRIFEVDPGRHFAVGEIEALFENTAP